MSYTFLFSVCFLAQRLSCANTRMHLQEVLFIAHMGFVLSSANEQQISKNAQIQNKHKILLKLFTGGSQY